MNSGCSTDSLDGDDGAVHSSSSSPDEYASSNSGRFNDREPRLNLAQKYNSMESKSIGRPYADKMWLDDILLELSQKNYHRPEMEPSTSTNNHHVPRQLDYCVEDDENIEHYPISVSPIQSPQASLISRSETRGLNYETVRWCARLVECRSLVEAIELVNRNRDLIDSLTRIVTHDAPAFRNYDMANYQIDYSVKESFNPVFWRDREPIVTTADGNCQYHAVSLSLTGSEDYTPEVRLATAVAVLDHREWFDIMLKLIDRGSVLDLVHTIARSHSWGDETTLKAIAIAIGKRIFLYTCNMGKKDYEIVKALSNEELVEAFIERKYRGGTGIHAYADPLNYANRDNYIMLFHKSEHFIAVLPVGQQLTMFEPYNPIVPTFV